VNKWTLLSTNAPVLGPENPDNGVISIMFTFGCNEWVIEVETYPGG